MERITNRKIFITRLKKGKLFWKKRTNKLFNQQVTACKRNCLIFSSRNFILTNIFYLAERTQFALIGNVTWRETVSGNSIMKRTIILAFLFIIFSCKNENTEVLPTKSEINDIIKSAILNDSLGVLFENKKIPICNDLRKINLVKHRKLYSEGYSEIKKFDSILIQDLIYHKKMPYKDFFKPRFHVY